MKKGFTFIELLVVISIIFILVGLLLPAITTARLNGKISEEVKVGEVLYIDGNPHEVIEVEKTNIRVKNEKEQIQVVKFRNLKEEEQKRLLEGSHQFAADVMTQFPYSVGSKVRHVLNEWQGVVIEVTGRTATIRFDNNGKLQTITDVTAQEVY